MKNIQARRNARRVIAVLLTLVVAVSFARALPAHADSVTITTNWTFPVDDWVYTTCGYGGAEEYIHFVGAIHSLYSLTVNASGGFHVHQLYNAQDVSGTGLITGRKYVFTGQTQYDYDIPSSGTYLQSYVSTFSYIAQGPGNNIMLHYNAHLTINPDGTLTAYVDNFSASCQ